MPLQDLDWYLVKLAFVSVVAVCLHSLSFKKISI